MPDHGYPDYPSDVALAGAQLVPRQLEAPAWAPGFEAAPRGCGRRLLTEFRLAVSDETLELGLEPARAHALVISVRRHIGIRIDGVRAVLLAIALVVATGLVACVSDEDEPAAPLTLEQRLLRESEVPGSKVDPVEVRLTADDLDEFTGWQDVRSAEIDRSKLENAGFVSAIHETRFIPKTSGGPHARDAPHVRVLVLQFESDDGAVTGVDLVREESLKPCPGECSMQFEEFDVSGVPDAEGTRSFTTKESLEATGGEGVPSDSYMIVFADGPFVYEVEGFAAPGEISKKQIEEIAQKLHDRIEGAPPAET